MSNNILEIKNLAKTYHTKTNEIEALKNITFNVEKKQFISIVGPSGCGKSTILTILANILEKSSGEIKYNIENPKIGYMLQEDALFSWKTVLQNAYLGLEIKNKLNKKSKEKVINLLKKYGLKDFVNNYPNSLSGGLKQRVVCN